MIANYKNIVSHLNNPTQVQQDLIQYQFAHCMSPLKLRLWDSLLGEFVEKEVNCGHCYHCTHSKSQEFVTRMLCHNEHWGFRYFITLTYDSYNPYFDSVIDKARSVEFAETLPVYDADNSTAHKAFHPCLLSRSHLRNYLKRLRVSLSEDYPDIQISYFACGELGHLHGRPHYHLVIWSKRAIDKKYFVNAWGKLYTRHKGVVKPWRNQKGVAPVFVPFGNVDFCDLNNPRYSKGHKSMQHVFGYVAKYVTKYCSWSDENLPTFNYCRLKLAYKSYDHFTLVARYFKEKNCLKSKFHLNFHIDELSNCSSPKVPFNEHEFYRAFSPFAVQSCVYTIGKCYLLDNFEVLSKGLSKLPSFDNFIPRFPSYFRRKINERCYPLRICKSSKGSSSLSLGSIPLIEDALHKLSISSDLDDAKSAYQGIRENAVLFSKKIAESPAGSCLDPIRFVDCHLYDAYEKLHLLFDPLNKCFNFSSYASGTYETKYSLSFNDTFVKYGKAFAYLRSERCKLDTMLESESRALTAIEIGLASKYGGVDVFPKFVAEANKRIDYNLHLHQRDYYAEKVGLATLY